MAQCQPTVLSASQKHGKVSDPHLQIFLCVAHYSNRENLLASPTTGNKDNA